MRPPLAPARITHLPSLLMLETGLSAPAPGPIRIRWLTRQPAPRIESSREPSPESRVPRASGVESCAGERDASRPNLAAGRQRECSRVRGQRESRRPSLLGISPAPPRDEGGGSARPAGEARGSRLAATPISRPGARRRRSPARSLGHRQQGRLPQGGLGGEPGGLLAAGCWLQEAAAQLARPWMGDLRTPFPAPDGMQATARRLPRRRREGDGDAGRADGRRASTSEGTRLSVQRRASARDDRPPHTAST
ncbi:hypothetical protein B2J93_5041 [Marssonina coronariae]|uniref:Uncharacterized protein n=1 Tax=Diplocarpon coronariae TaxID=2795749 RepID=A0A218Z426_9HELO|nr:hypothetical protein B2J93_5041 [Marssonina coronariae]